eukprot:363412-Chlamydomonas_euryale.AAC.9
MQHHLAIWRRIGVCMGMGKNIPPPVPSPLRNRILVAARRERHSVPLPPGEKHPSARPFPVAQPCPCSCAPRASQRAPPTRGKTSPRPSLPHCATVSL